MMVHHLAVIVSLPNSASMPENRTVQICALLSLMSNKVAAAFMISLSTTDTSPGKLKI